MMRTSQLSEFDNLKLLIFDLDGVILSERKYWDIARRTVWTLITGKKYLGLDDFFESESISPRLILKKIIPEKLFYVLKNRAINSNWDITFWAFCWYLAGILEPIWQSKKDELSTLFLASNVFTILPEIAKVLSIDLKAKTLAHPIQEFFLDIPTEEGKLTDQLAGFVIARLPGINESLLEVGGPLWKLCYEVFQELYKHPNVAFQFNGKNDGILPFEPPCDWRETILAPSRIRKTLMRLQQHYSLGIATGRPLDEALAPLEKEGLITFFERDRIVTQNDVIDAEDLMFKKDVRCKLAKPHPFIVLKSIYPHLEIEDLVYQRLPNNTFKEVAFIGDAASDVIAAKRIGCKSVGVLTGLDKLAAKNKADVLKSNGCDLILNNICDLEKILL